MAGRGDGTRGVSRSGGEGERGASQWIMNGAVLLGAPSSQSQHTERFEITCTYHTTPTSFGYFSLFFFSFILILYIYFPATLSVSEIFHLKMLASIETRGKKKERRKERKKISKCLRIAVNLDMVTCASINKCMYTSSTIRGRNSRHYDELDLTNMILWSDLKCFT